MSSTTVERILSIVIVSPSTGSFSLPFLMSSIRASAPAEFFSFASVATKIIFFPYERPRSFILRNMSATLSMATTPDALLSAPG